MINFSGVDEDQNVVESIHKKIFQMKMNIVQLMMEIS